MSAQPGLIPGVASVKSAAGVVETRGAAPTEEWLMLEARERE
jgi:hypothetical protein